MKLPVVEPYLAFGGRCEEAVQFYQTALGAEVDLMMRYRDCPDGTPDWAKSAQFENKIMHASFRIGGSRIMACDDPQNHGTFNGIMISVTYPTPAEAQSTFDALAVNGEIRMPMGKTFWSPWFGMVVDRFGLLWMVTIPG